MSQNIFSSQRDFLRVRKFDLVLEHEDGNEYDGTGCLPCLPWCRKPVYIPGQHITGYLLIRPMRKFTITGVKILFEGTYKTGWCEHNLKWLGCRSFYIDCVSLIRGRSMELECKWYRFDFEHVLPKVLMPSFKAQHCKIVYSATGLVTQPNMPDLQTFETHFQVKAPVDIRLFPDNFHQPVSKSASKAYQIKNTLNRTSQSTSHNQEAVSDASQASNEALQENPPAAIDKEGKISASIWLSKQAVVPKDIITIELYVDNGTAVTFEVLLYLDQVLSLKPTYALRKRTSEYVPLGSYPSKKISNKIVNLWNFDLHPHLAESNSIRTEIPNVIPNLIHNSSSVIRNCPEVSFFTPKEPLINIQYFIKLKVKEKGQLDSSATNILSVELKIGNHDSGQQTNMHLVGGASRTARMHSRQHYAITGASDEDLINHEDISDGEDSVFEITMRNIDRNSPDRSGYTPDTEGPPAYTDEQHEIKRINVSQTCSNGTRNRTYSVL